MGEGGVHESDRILVEKVRLRAALPGRFSFPVPTR